MSGWIQAAMQQNTITNKHEKIVRNIPRFFFCLHTKVSACLFLKNLDIQTEKESVDGPETLFMFIRYVDVRYWALIG